jgi:hypothetical protein
MKHILDETIRNGYFIAYIFGIFVGLFLYWLFTKFGKKKKIKYLSEVKINYFNVLQFSGGYLEHNIDTGVITIWDDDKKIKIIAIIPKFIYFRTL